MTVRPFHILAKPIGPICNLDCTYCFYLEKERLYPGNKDWAMAEPLLEAFIRQSCAAQQGPVVHFAWQGGEPTLLGVEYFRRILELEERYADGRPVENSLQTNAVLLDDEWAEFLSAKGFLVGVSLDGPRPLHDRYRVDKGGQPTFDRVLRGIGVLKKHGVAFNTLTTVHRANAEEPLAVYRFLREHGGGHMQFIPIVERSADAALVQIKASALPLAGPSQQHAPVTEWSVEPNQYGRFLCAIFDEWVRHDVGRQFVQLFEVCLQIWSGLEPGLCIFRKSCGDALALEHSGDLYSCDHFVYPEYRLGNLRESPLEDLLASADQRAFGEAKWQTLPRACRECEVRFACNGECPKHRFMTTKEGEPGLNYLCAAYKRFFRHVDAPMRWMARALGARRSPAGVMQWMAAEDRRQALADAGRNQPCPCGSGRKFKRCCGAAG